MPQSINLAQMRSMRNCALRLQFRSHSIEAILCVLGGVWFHVFSQRRDRFGEVCDLLFAEK